MSRIIDEVLVSEFYLGFGLSLEV